MGIETATIEGLATVAVLFASFSFLLPKKEHGAMQIFFFLMTFFTINALTAAMYELALKDTTYTGVSTLLLGIFVASLFVTTFVLLYFTIKTLAWSFTDPLEKIGFIKRRTGE